MRKELIGRWFGRCLGASPQTPDRTSLPGTETDALAPIWCAVILGVHRGGRTKLKAITQMQTAILQRPARAAELIPVLTAAVRSLRAPERRSALAAVASIVVQNADLQAEIQRLLPELQWVAGSYTPRGHE